MTSPSPTPWKDLENDFWTWLAAHVSLPSDLHLFKSYDGRPLPFLADAKAFMDPSAVPAMWLKPAKLDPTLESRNTTLDRVVFRGGLVFAVPPNAPTRDTFETLVTSIRYAILGQLTRHSGDVGASIDVHELAEESVIEVDQALGGAVLGYVWTFRLTLGLQTVHSP